MKRIAMTALALVRLYATGSDQAVSLLEDRWGDAIAVGLDARDGKLATRGWLDQSDSLAIDVAQALAGG